MQLKQITNSAVVCCLGGKHNTYHGAALPCLTVPVAPLPARRSRLPFAFQSNMAALDGQPWHTARDLANNVTLPPSLAEATLNKTTSLSAEIDARITQLVQQLKNQLAKL